MIFFGLALFYSVTKAPIRRQRLRGLNAYLKRMTSERKLRYNLGEENFLIVLIHLKMKSIKEWSSWLKILGILSAVAIILDIVVLFPFWIQCFTRFCSNLVTDIILLPILGIIVGCWVIGFLINHLKNNNKKWFGRIVLIGGSIIFGIIVMLTLLEYIGIEGFDFRGWFPLPFSLVVFLFFIISLIINSRKSRADISSMT